jgi:phosphatidylserine/phosphatidylglycerophosphate/cardiolipin synthase-like enzyme
VLIVAPFLGHRLGQLVPSLVAASGRGVAVTALVRPEDAAKAWAQRYLGPLRAGGVAVVERTDNMHEKVVVVDRHVAYHGSLNPLSHVDTTESVMRFTCPSIAESLYVLFHPSVGQSFAERVSIEILSGRGRQEWRTAWGDPPPWWRNS